MMQKKIKKGMAAMWVAILVAGSCVFAYAEDQYILLLPASPEITYELDADHISEEYSTDEYTILLYEADESVEFEIITGSDFVIEDVADGMVFDVDFSEEDNVVSFVMPEKDLCLIPQEEEMPETGDQGIMPQPVYQEGNEILPENSISVSLTGGLSAEILMVDESSVSLDFDESITSEEKIDLIDVSFEEGSYSEDPSVFIFKNGDLIEDDSDIIVIQTGNGVSYRIDVSNDMDLDGVYEIFVVNSDGDYSGIESGQDEGAEPLTESETESKSETEVKSETEAETETEAKAETDAQAETESKIGTGAKAETEAKTSTNTNVRAETEAKTEEGTNTNTSNADIETETVFIDSEVTDQSADSSQYTYAEENSVDFTFRIEMEEGYARTGEFVVKANGEELEENPDGSFTIHDMTDNQAITVEGIIETGDLAPQLSAEAETFAGKGDGRISGLDTTMEYSRDGIRYTKVTDPEMEFAQGVYYVRYAAHDDEEASEAVEVRIDEGRKLVVIFMDESEIVDVMEVDYEESIPESDLPEVPEKEGYESSETYWDADSFDNITEDKVVHAVYPEEEVTIFFAAPSDGYRDSAEE